MKQNFWQKPWFPVLSILLLGFLAYSNTFHVPFTFDDERYIVNNPAIKNLAYFAAPGEVKGLHTLTPTLQAAFLTRIFGHFTFALNYAVGGLDVTGYHIFNLLVHLANALLVYFLVLLTFRTPYFMGEVSGVKNEGPEARDEVGLIALFSALLFVAHPVQTQAVTYITQRFASLGALFYLLCLVMYIEFRLSRGSSLKAWTFYAASLLSAVLGMLTKENTFTLPVVVALYEFMFSEGDRKKRAAILLPLFLTMLIIPSTLLMTKGSITDISGIDESMKTLAATPTISRLDYLLTQFRVIMTYLRLLFVPVNQNLDYDYRIYHSFFTPAVFLSFLFLLCLFSVAVYLLYKSRLKVGGWRSEDRGLSLGPQASSLNRLIAFGIFWFFITLSMESSIIPIADVIFEHRLYLPSAGFFMSFVTGLFLIAEKKGGRKAVTAVLACVVVVFSAAAYARNAVWADETRFWADVVQKSPLKARARVTLGALYARQNHFREALHELETVVKLAPDYADAYNSIGVVYKKTGRFEDALRYYRTAIRIKPDFAEAHNNLGLLYNQLGNREAAAEEFKRALTIKPDYASAHNSLGAIYGDEGRLDEAEREFLAALSYNPDDAEAARNLSILRGMKSR